MYHGEKEERSAFRAAHFDKIVKSQVHIVITSFDVAIRDKRYLKKFDWKYLVIDEAHRLKNFNCRLIKELRRYRTDNRLLLTGTPLQNNLGELWSLLNFLLPGTKYTTI